MSKQRLQWAIHNIIGHPLMEISSWFGLVKFSSWIHDSTFPKSEDKK